MQIKVDNEIFECIDGTAQLSFGSHATLNIIFDLDKFPKYELFFIKIYESEKIFKTTSSKFQSSGCKIKSLDIDYREKKMEISIHSDIFETKEVSNRRDEAINELLQKTFKDKEDIN
jgi:hypothetical protein